MLSPSSRRVGDISLTIPSPSTKSSGEGLLVTALTNGITPHQHHQTLIPSPISSSSDQSQQAEFIQPDEYQRVHEESPELEAVRAEWTGSGDAAAVEGQVSPIVVEESESRSATLESPLPNTQSKRASNSSYADAAFSSVLPPTSTRMEHAFSLPAHHHHAHTHPFAATSQAIQNELPSATTASEPSAPTVRKKSIIIISSKNTTPQLSASNSIAQLPPPSYDELDAPIHSGATQPHHATEMQSHPHSLFADFNHVHSDASPASSFTQPIDSHIHVENEVDVLPMAQARTIGLEVELAVFREQRQHHILDMDTILESPDAATTKNKSFFPEKKLSIEMSDGSSMSPPPFHHHASLSDTNAALRQSSLTSDFPLTSSTLQQSNNTNLQESKEESTSPLPPDANSPETQRQTIIQRRLQAPAIKTAGLTAPTGSPESPLTPAPATPGGTFRPRSNSRVGTRKRNLNPLPPLVPLLPHERTAPPIAAAPQPAFTRERGNSFSQNGNEALTSKMFGRPKPPPRPLSRQSTLNIIGSPRVIHPKVKPVQPDSAAAVAKPTEKPKGLPTERQDSFDHSERTFGLMSLDRTAMKRKRAMAIGDGPDTSHMDPHAIGSHRFFTCCTEKAVIPADSIFLAYWRVAILFFILYNAIVIPFRIAFDGLPYTKPGAQEVSYLLDHLGDLLFIIDIAISFRTAFVQHGVKISQPPLIQKRYLSSWAIFDFLAAIPFDFIQLYNMQLNPLVRLPKLLRCVKLLDMSLSLESAAPGLNVNPRVLKLMKMPFYIFYASHVIACAWFGVGRIEGFGHSEWNVPAALGYDGSLTFQYLRSLFWALGLMTGRDYENSTPETDLESLVTFTAMTVGMIGLAYVIGNIAALVEGANEKAKHFQARVSFVARFMSSYEIPPSLSDQVTRFFEYMWSRNKGFDLPSVLAELPDVLTTDISMFLLQDIVNRVELFGGLDPGFVPALIKKMVANVYLPGEFIVTYGDFGDSMYFIQQGEVDIIKGGTASTVQEGEEGGEVILHTLKTGDRFGEYSLILPTQRTASARAIGFCTVYVLYREPFEEIMKVFTKSAAVIRDRAKAHHDITLKREQELLKQQMQQQTGQVARLDSFPVGGTITPVEYEVETLRLVLRNKDNAKEFRKKISVYAFKVDSPVTVNKSWGVSQCEKDDWLVIGGDSDAYTVGNQMFMETYEPIPGGAKHTYRKKGTVLGVQVARPFKIQTPKEVLTCKASDYLVQDEKLNQWFVPQATFEDTYELCVEKAPPIKRNILDANSAVIKALKGRAESTVMTHGPVDPRVIFPTSTFWRIWQPIVFAIMLYNTLFVPFRIAFDIHSVNPAYMFFDYVGDVIMFIDIYLHFRLAFVKDGTLVHDLKQIRAKYLKGMFYFDVLACFPLDFFMIYTGMQPLFRLGRVLRIYNCYRISHHYIKNNRLAGGLKLARMLFSFALFAHFESCIYFSFTYFEGFGDGVTTKWLPTQSDYEDAPLAHKYFRSQYFSFVVLTGLGKMIVPTTNAEAVFSLLSILLGVVVVSFIIGEIASIVSNLDTFAVENDKRVLAMNEFMRYNHLPHDLQQRVRRFLDHQWSVQRGADPNKALNGLPPMLRLQMKMQVCGDAIRRTPFFHQAADATLLAIVSCITFETYPPGEAIFMVGQIGEKVYIVNRGMVEIQVPDPDTGLPITIKTIGKGSFFGEASLMKSGRRSASAICQKSCDLMVIARKDFLRIIHEDPDFASHLEKIMQNRLAGVNAVRKPKKSKSKNLTLLRAAPIGATMMARGKNIRSSMFVGGAPTHKPKTSISILPIPQHKRGQKSQFAMDDQNLDGAQANKPIIVRKASNKVDTNGTTPPPLFRSFSFATTLRDHREIHALRESMLHQRKSAHRTDSNDIDDDDDDDDDDEDDAMGQGK